MHHNPYFNLFILPNNPFDNQENEISEFDIFFIVSTYCLLGNLKYEYAYMHIYVCVSIYKYINKKDFLLRLDILPFTKTFFLLHIQ